MKNCLTIAGSDCSGGAGIQADIKSMSANGVFAMSVIVAVVAENTSKVISTFDLPQSVISDQLQAVFDDITVHAVKIGMLSTKETMHTVAKILQKYKPPFIVTDPVILATDGHALMQNNALDILKSEIIPLTYLLTPNILEAEMITGKEIHTKEDMRNACKTIYSMGTKNVLIKGGHLKGNADDVLFDGDKFYTFSAVRINTKNTHGTGCTLSSAITANLANGYSTFESVQKAKIYITGAIENALEIGKGHGPTNHFYEFYEQKGIK